MNVFLGVDIGASRVRAKLVDRQGRCLVSYDHPTDRRTPGNTLGRLQVWVDDQCRRSEIDSYVSAAGIGVASPEVDGILGDSSNLPGWRGVNLRRECSGIFRLETSRVAVRNDAMMAALGEYSLSPRSLVGVTWGTGIGVGRLRKPANGYLKAPFEHPFEGGHLTLSVKSRVQCGCGAMGHWEALVGGNHLEARFGRPPEEVEDDAEWMPVLADMAAGLRSLSHVFPGDPIYISGGVMEKQKARFPVLLELFTALDGTVEPPRLALATRGDWAGLDGAVFCALQLA